MNQKTILASLCLLLSSAGWAQSSNLTPSYPLPLLVFDADGKTVGRFGSSATETWKGDVVYLPLKNALYSVALTRSAPPYPIVFRTTTVYFVLPNCQGSPFTNLAEDNHQSVIPTGAVFRESSGRLFIYPPISYSFQAVTAQSWLVAGNCLPNSGDRFTGVQMGAPVLLQFAEPLTIR